MTEEENQRLCDLIAFKETLRLFYALEDSFNTPGDQLKYILHSGHYDHLNERHFACLNYYVEQMIKIEKLRGKTLTGFDNK